jgi:hypothetical protein
MHFSGEVGNGAEPLKLSTIAATAATVTSAKAAKLNSESAV